MKRKYILISILILVSSLFIFLIFSSIMISSLNKKYNTNKMNHYLAIVKSEFDGSNMESASDVLVMVDSQIRVTFINKEGIVIYDSKAISESNHLDRPEILNLGSINIRYSETLKIKMAYIATIKDDIYIRVSMPKSSINQIVSNLFLYGILLIIVIGILSFILYDYVSKKLVLPIKNETNKLAMIVGNDINNELGDDLVQLSYQIEETRKMIDSKISSSNNERDKLKYIIQNMQQGLVIIDGEGNISLINEKACKLFDRELDILNKNYIYLFSNVLIQEKVLYAMNNNYSDNIVINIENKSYLFYITSLLDSFASIEGKNGVSIFIMDITIDKQIEKMKLDFFANASHELKSPLTSIIGYQQMIKEGILTDEEEIMEATNKTIKESNRMNQIIIEMLELSKLETKPNRTKEKLSILDNCNDVLSHFEDLINKKNLDVIISNDDFYVEMNNNDLYQLVKNLIENAIKYNKENGKIIVNINSIDRILEVKDTGIGVSETDKNRIFERFYRVDKAKSKELGGTGLGLAIVKHICINYKIKISVESKLNEGTNFYLKF